MGLKPFTENDSKSFYGRQKLIDELISKLQESSFLVVIGSSGSGKSSVVLAGLLPKLKQGEIEGSKNWHYYPSMIPGDKPLENLAQIIQPDDIGEYSIEEQVEEFKKNPQHFSQLVNNYHKD